MSSKLRQLSGPKSLHETPLVPIEIAGEKHQLRFDMRAVGRLEAELGRGILDIWQSLAAGQFRVQLVLAAIAAGIAHEYRRGQEPTWEDIGTSLDDLNQVNPLVQPVLDALLKALNIEKAAPAAEESDPNAAAPAAAG